MLRVGSLIGSLIPEIGMVVRVVEKNVIFSEQSLIFNVSNDGSNATQRVLDVGKAGG